MRATNTVLVPTSKYSCVCKRTQKISLAVGQNLDYHILYKPKHKAFYKESLNAEDDLMPSLVAPADVGVEGWEKFMGGQQSVVLKIHCSEIT